MFGENTIKYVVRQGEKGETFYMITGGTVDVLQESIDPKSGEFPVAIHDRLEQIIVFEALKNQSTMRYDAVDRVIAQFLDSCETTP